MPSLRRPGQTLTLHISEEPAPAVPETAASDAVWEDGGGGVVAYGGTRGHDRWMTVVGVGVYVFRDARDDVVAYSDAGVDRTVVEDAYRRTVLPLALQASGNEVLHASAVHTPAGVIALCAVSGTGKSTIALALSLRGHSLWADDAVQFHVGADRADTIPVPFTLRLKGEAATQFGAHLGEEIIRPEPAPLAAVFVLERGEDVSVERLAAVDAFPAVLAHAYCFDLNDAARKREMTDAYLRLCTAVPVFKASVPAGLDRLEELVDEILLAAS